MGRAGRGASKVRGDAGHYAAMAARSAEVRRAKRVAEVLGVRDLGPAFGCEVIVTWPGQREGKHPAWVSFDSRGKVSGNSGDIPRRWERACEIAALAEVAAYDAAEKEGK